MKAKRGRCLSHFGVLDMYRVLRLENLLAYTHTID